MAATTLNKYFSLNVTSVYSNSLVSSCPSCRFYITASVATPASAPAYGRKIKLAKYPLSYMMQMGQIWIVMTTRRHDERAILDKKISYRYFSESTFQVFFFTFLSFISFYFLLLSLNLLSLINRLYILILHHT